MRALTPAIKNRRTRRENQISSPISILTAAIATQALGTLITFGIFWSGAETIGTPFPAIPFIATQAVIVGVVTVFLRLPYWWVPIQISFGPAIYLMQSLDISAWWFLCGFLLLLGIFRNVAAERVPLFLTNRNTTRALDDFLIEHPAKYFIDLGCGIGGPLFYLARRHPGCRFCGIESAPIPFFLAWIRSLGGPQNLQITYGDLWSKPLTEFDVVYCFLSPQAMPALWRKATREMKPASHLISNSFTIPGAPEPEIIYVRKPTPDRGLLHWAIDACCSLPNDPETPTANPNLTKLGQFDEIGLKPDFTEIL